VQAQGRTVIPVARIRAAGGGGRDGGGGRLSAEPVGFIEVSADGARFEPIGRGRVAGRIAAAGGAALTGLAAAAALRQRRAALPRRPRRRLLHR
jgi:hypothetical protein